MTSEVPTSLTDLRDILWSANEGAAKDLASEIKRLRAQIASAEAEIQRYQSENTLLTTAAETRTAKLQQHNRLLIESATEAASALQQNQAELRQALIEIATLTSETERLRAEHAAISQRAAHLEEHNRLLTESATETARKLQDCEYSLTEAHVEIATLAPENERLRVEHAVISERAAELDEHNQLVTTSASETARKLQEQEAQVTHTLIQLATLKPENERLRAEHAVISQRAAELEQHNQLLTASVTETARKLQERDAEMTRMQIQVATLAPEDERLRAEHAEISKRAAALREHNRLLTESATETARKLQERDAELTRTQIEIGTLASENARLRAEHADISRRAAELQEHNRLLTESATETARKLQESRETD